MDGQIVFFALLGMLIVHLVHSWDKNGITERVFNMHLRKRINEDEASYILGIPVRDYIQAFQRWCQNNK